MSNFNIGNINVSLDGDLFLMSGPCVIESLDHCLLIADKLQKICDKLDVGLVFKASFDKANRSSISSYRGPGLNAGLEILSAVRQKTGLPIMTDIHEPNQAMQTGYTVDCIQIPAFLCRQTDLLVAAAKTGKPISIKKGQFMSPAEMKNVVEKMEASDCKKVMLTERGTFFGYNRLVNDMSSMVQFRELGCPAIFDVTHSTQMPGGLGNASGGVREMGPILAKAAIAAGANGLFIESHNDPENAKSDAGTVMPLEWIEETLKVCKDIHSAVKDSYK